MKGRFYPLQNMWTQRVLFWSVSWFFFYRLFSNATPGFSQLDAFYALLFLLLMAPVVLLTNGWLMSRFLNRNLLIPFFALFIVFNIAGTYLNLFFFSSVIDVLFPGLYFINYYSFAELLQFYLAFSTVAALLQLSKGWFLNLKSAQQIERLKQEKLAAQLKALKSQVNPHFLFNSLNNIYSLSLKQSERAPRAILQLSELLRYNLYHTDKDLVPVAGEVEMVERYIDLQKIRFTQAPEIRFTIDMEQSNLEIPPMLLQPLFENAFKYGNPESKPMMEAKLEVAESGFKFSISNTKLDIDSGIPDEDGGVGLDNIRQRLELLYPSAHQFGIVETDQSFSVTLSIESL